MQSASPFSAAPTAQPTPFAPTTEVPDEGEDVEGCGYVEVSFEEDVSIDSSPEKIADN